MDDDTLEWAANHKPSSSSESEKNWRTGYILGEPQATAQMTAEELKARGYVGLYLRKRTGYRERPPVTRPMSG